ncbi:MAG: hypothetical protein ACK4QW_06230 [Alphaproteobacteria bacterium]
MAKVLAIALLLFLGACSTYTPQRYTISADNNVALKTLGVGGVAVGPFAGPPKFDPACRLVGPIGLPDGLSFEAYIQKALADELKVAGMYEGVSPRVTLTGAIEHLSFSSTRGITGGLWEVTLRLYSSNGRSMVTSESYSFRSGYMAETGCKQTAEAFLPTVQNLIGKLIADPRFRGLVEA